jgi:transposase
MVPPNHLLRRLEAVVDLAFVRELCASYYSHTGQPSIDPVVLFKMMLLGYLYGITSERRLAEECALHLAFRWYLGCDLDEPTPDHSVLSKARARYGQTVFEVFFQRVLMLCLEAGLLTSTDSVLVHVHTDFWEKARRYVADGGALYASLSADVAIPEMEGLFGARLVDHSPVSEVTLKVVTPWGGLNPGDTFHYFAAADNPRQWAVTLEVQGGTVIAVDQAGRPALIANTLGKGKTLLCAYPLESYLAGVPSVFDQEENTHRIYQAFRDWAGVKPRFCTSQPSVEAVSLNAQDHGYVVVVNHSAMPQRVTVTSALSLKSIQRVTPNGEQPVSLHGSQWDLDLQPYGAAVLEWK